MGSGASVQSQPKVGSSEQSDGQRDTSDLRVEPSLCPDIMISYSHQDKKFMSKLRDGLQAAGLRVWVDVTDLKAGVDFLSKIGQAIIDSTVFISLLSEDSIVSKYCKDELALAYVSNKAIFPVGLQSSSYLFPKMDTGMRLLACFDWNLFVNVNNFDKDLKQLIDKIRSYLKKIGHNGTTEKNEKNIGEKGPVLKRHMSRLCNSQLNKDLVMDKLELINDDMTEAKMKAFWTRHFTENEVVSWTGFLECFHTDYKTALDVVFGENDINWLESILYRDLTVQENNVKRENYIEFCTVDGEFQPFWVRVQNQAVESYAVREVFNMDSSVRVEAIENLGKFHSPAVTEALLDLLSDSDYNVRAVACISLARSGANNKRVVAALCKGLSEKDRLVRESACLALGHVKAEVAIPKLMNIWRNDFISSVREAAQVALEQIGGEEAQKAMHITKVLSEEIRLLTKD